jgi:hypothetical protein
MRVTTSLPSAPVGDRERVKREKAKARVPKNYLKCIELQANICGVRSDRHRMFGQVFCVMLWGGGQAAARPQLLVLYL